MSLIIRKGAAEDLDAVEKLYGEVCDHMAATVNYTGWRRDIYPARQDAEAGIREGTLFLAEEDGEAAGSFILSPRQEAAYAGVKWQADLEERDVRTIYTFTVSPRRRGRGVFHAKRKRERVSATPIERHQEVAEERVRGAEPSEAQLHEGASEPAVDTCLISAVAIRKAPSSPRAFCD